MNKAIYEIALAFSPLPYIQQEWTNQTRSTSLFFQFCNQRLRRMRENMPLTLETAHQRLHRWTHSWSDFKEKNKNLLLTSDLTGSDRQETGWNTWSGKKKKSRSSTGVLRKDIEQKLLTWGTLLYAVSPNKKQEPPWPQLLGRNHQHTEKETVDPGTHGWLVNVAHQTDGAPWVQEPPADTLLASHVEAESEGWESASGIKRKLPLFFPRETEAEHLQSEC